MPSHGAEIIDGVPVILRDSTMYSFHHGASQPATQIALGTYDAATKKATWNDNDALSGWLSSYREGLTSRSRK